MKEACIFHWDIQIPTEKARSLSKWLQRWHNLTFFVGTFNYQLKKTVQYWNDFKYEGTLHLMLGYSNSNWNRRFSIEMITKMTEPYILSGDIQIPTEKTVQYRNDFKDHSTLHPLWGHSSFYWKKNSLVLKWFQRWQNHAFFVETFKFQLKNHFSILMISTVKELTSSVGTFRFQLKKTVQYWNDLKDYRTLHPLRGDSDPN